MKVSWLVLAAMLGMPVLADEPGPKVTLELKDAPLRQAFESLTKQSGIPVVAGPNVRATVTLNVKDVPLEQAISTIASLNNLRWRRIDFAIAKDMSISAEVINSALAALEAVPVLGMMVSEPEQKTRTLFAREIPNPTPPQLPEGWKWQTVYLVQKPEEKPKADEADAQSATSPVEAVRQRLDALNQERLNLLMSLNPDQRAALAQDEFYRMMEMNPDMRRDLFRGWASAIGSLGPDSRRDFFRDMRETFRQLRPEGERRGRGFREGPGP